MIPRVAFRRASVVATLQGSRRVVAQSPMAFFPQLDSSLEASSSRSILHLRQYSADPGSSRSGSPLEGESREQEIRIKLEEALKPTRLAIQDTSGGCGTFFNIDIESEAFQGMSKVKQHKEVMRILKQEITNEMHGVSLRTALPGQ